MNFRVNDAEITVLFTEINKVVNRNPVKYYIFPTFKFPLERDLPAYFSESP